MEHEPLVAFLSFLLMWYPLATNHGIWGIARVGHTDNWVVGKGDHVRSCCKEGYDSCAKLGDDY